MDEVSKVECPDCGEESEYAFVLVAHDGRKGALMKLGACSKCKRRGDKRSFYSLVEADRKVIQFAVNNRLPVLIL